MYFDWFDFTHHRFAQYHRQKGFVGILVLAILIAAVSGYFVYSNYSNNRTGEAPSPIASPSSQADGTANWETYTNTKYGYSVKYPGNWFVKDLSDQMALNIEHGVFFNVSNQITPSNYKFYISIDRERDYEDIILGYGDAGHQTTVEKSETITVDGKVARKALISSSNVTNDGNWIREEREYIVVVIKTTKPFLIVLKDSRDQKVFDQILSTFKFIDQTSSSSCQPRPACLDATPKCLIPEPASGWCP